MTNKNLTPEQIAQKQKEALGKLWELFGYNKSAIARACDSEPGVIGNWFARGRISATGAIKLEKRPEVQGRLTKEEMRPDVTEWYGV